MSEIEALKDQIITLRARIAVTERVAWLGAEMAAIMRPRETLEFVEEQREVLANALSKPDAQDGFGQEERSRIAREIETRFAELIRTVKQAGRID